MKLLSETKLWPFLLKVGSYKLREGPDFIAPKVQYDHQCKRMPLHQKEKSTSKSQFYRRKRNLFILGFVESKVITGQKPIPTSFLLKHYKKYYADVEGHIDDLQSYTIQNIFLHIKKT